jgi:hypothetical protein
VAFALVVALGAGPLGVGEVEALGRKLVARLRRRRQR